VSVSEVNGAWQERRLRDAVTKLVDGSHNPPAKQDSGHPMLSARNVEQGNIVFDDFRFISDEAFVTEDARTRVAPGDVLLTIVGTIGRSAVVPQGIAPFALQRSVAVLSPVSDLDSRFLSYQLQSPRIQRHFEAHARGTAQKGVYLKTLGETPLVLPGLDEQLKIVAEIEKQFSRLDEAVANLQRVKANLRRYRSSVLVNALADGSKHWRWATYAEVGEITTGFTPPTGEAANFGGELPFFKPTDLDAGDNVRAAREYLSERGISKGRRLRAGSVLVTCIGATIGKTGLAAVECATNQQINAVSPRDGIADPRFVYWWTVSPVGQRQIRDNASATTLPIINKSKFSALAVPLPPLDEQLRIVAEVDRRLSIVQEVEAEVDANLKRAQALRQAVLGAAFRPSDCPLLLPA
jgi:type I restriction enzyme S subunit